MPTTAPPRTLDPGITIFTAAEIRVAVLPLGAVPRDVLDEYLQLMQRFRSMSLSAVRSFYQRRSDKTPFQSLDWSVGALHFRFMQMEEARRKSRLLELHPSRQVVAVLGIVHCPVTPSIVQACDEFNKACKEQFPEARVTRCFAFEPSEDHIVQGNQQHIPGLVVFPPAGGQAAHLEQHLEVWMHDLAALVLAELEQWVLDPTPRSGPRTSANYTDNSEFVGAVTVMEEVAKRLSIPDDEVREKRRRGRLHKAQGDVCLMAGSPKDAVNNYRVAQELSKATNDWVWYGAALEALAYVRAVDPSAAAAKPIQASNAPASGAPAPAAASGAGSHTAEAGRAHVHGSASWPSWEVLRSRGVELEIRELLSDAKACYKRKGGVLAMQIENSTKLARLLVGLHGRTARREVLELASWIVEAGAMLHFLEDRLVALSEAAQLYGAVGAARRRALLLWAAADMARSIDKYEMLRLAIKGIEPPEDEVRQEPHHPETSHRLHWSLKQAGLSSHTWQTAFGTSASAALPSLQPQGPAASLGLLHRGAVWHNIQVAMQDMLLQAARQTGMPGEAWEATAAMLRLHLSSLPPSAHAPMLEGLTLAASALPPKLRHRPGLGPPCPLARLRRILPLAPQHQTQRLAGPLGRGPRESGGSGSEGGLARAGSASPFIFNPNADKRRGVEKKEQNRRRGAMLEAELTMTGEWVCGEEGRVEVELSNPLSVPVKVDSLSLHALYSQPPLAQATRTILSTGVPSTPHPSPSHAPVSGSHALEQHQGSLWRPVAAQVLLPAHGKSVKVQLRGTALAPGTLTLYGLRVCALGAQWFEPFGLHLQQPSAGLGAGLGVGAAGSLRALQHRATARTEASAPAPPATPEGSGGARWQQSTVTVLPAMPILRAVLTRKERRAEDEVLAMAPFPEDLAPIATGQPSASVFPSAAATSALSTGGMSASLVPLAHTPSATSFASAPASAGTHGPVPHVPSAAALALLASRRAVPVWQGQRCCWDLHLTNQGSSPVTSAQVTVANQRGVVIKPLPHGHVQASYTGVHIQPSQKAAAALAASMPLQPGASIVVPIDVYVGQPPVDVYEEIALEVRIAYTGPNVPDTAAGLNTHRELLGRQLSVPVRFQVQHTVQVSGVQFVDAMVPLQDGASCWARHLKPEPSGALPHHAPRSQPGSSLVLPQLARLSQPLPGSMRIGLQGQDLASEGSSMFPSWSQEFKSFARPDSQVLWQAQEDAEVELTPSPSPATTSLKVMSWDGTSAWPDAQSTQPPGCSGGEAVTRLSLSSECTMEVAIVSLCERYLRVWLERVPSTVTEDDQRGGPSFGAFAAAASDSTVLPPGEASVLGGAALSALPPASRSLRPSSSLGAFDADASSSGGAGKAARPLTQEPDRMAAAEALCDAWVVAWRMIAPGEEEGNAPSGRLQLAAVDVARILTPQAVSSIQPSQLSFQLTAAYSSSTADSVLGLPAPRPRVQELTRRLQALDVRGAGTTGETWGVRLSIGELVDLEVEVSATTSSQPQLVQFSLGVTNLAWQAEAAPGSSSRPMDQTAGPGHGWLAHSAALPSAPSDPGVLLMGQVEKVCCQVEHERPHVHRMSVMCVQPGLYQLSVHDVVASASGAGPTAEAQKAELSDPHVWIHASRAYVNTQCLNLMCM